MTKYRKASTGAALITMATLIMGLLGPIPFAVKEAYGCETNECELELTKTDSVDPVNPGDELIYYLTLENVGTANCTGTGVRIKDLFDQNTTYVSSSKSPESITSEYIKWNVGTLYPEDVKNINLTMLVSEDAECDSVLINKVKFWSTQTDWSDYIIEETTIECLEESYCGDETVDEGEECDDGNNEDGDGCSAVCTIETPEPECTIDDDCDDNDVCNGTETCVESACQPGTPLVCNDENVCTDDSCDSETGCVFTPNTEPCDDGLFCTVDDVCSQGECSGAPRNCSENDLSEIATCGYDPDNNIFTWDFFAGFLSECNECTDTCTTETIELTHACDIEACGAECEEDKDCPDTICEDGCIGNDYYDYDNVANSCLEDCFCTDNPCGEPGITYNALACTGCQTDDDCDELDEDYCDGTLIMHDEGVCNESFECEVETTPGLDCDDGLYCNGQEGCSNANCVAGTPIDCSTYDLSSIETCEYDPDNNIFTWDFFAGFLSECDEETDSCTTGTETLTHACDIENCDAECEEDADCEEGGYCNSLCICEYEGEEPRCGDETVDEGEECDDGNTEDGDGCSAVCIIETSEPYCGDGVVNEGEECDDGNIEDGDGCSSTCTIEDTPPEPYCGDGNVDEGEECDNGEQNGQACSPSCESTCNYCTTICTVATLTGGSCGRGGNGGGGGGGGTPTYPRLIINKSVTEEFTNPDTTINYTIVVRNAGMATANNVLLADILPEGFTYKETGLSTRDWDLDNILRKSEKTVTYQVIIEEDVLVGNYVNTATVKANNLNPVSDDAVIEVRIPVVLGEMIPEVLGETPEVLGEMTELPDTGATTLMSILWIIAVITLISSTTALVMVAPRNFNLNNRNKKSFGNFAY